MLKFKEYITEIFDTKRKYTRYDKQYFRDKDNKIAEVVYLFKTKKGKKVKIVIFKNNNKIEIMFTVNNKTEQTNKGEALQIYSTVIDILKKYIKRNKNINEIEFTAYDRSYIDLFDRFGKMINKEGWSRKRESDENYHFMKKKI